MARPKKSSLDEETNLRLLRAGESAFGKSGYHATRLEDVAHSVGVRRQSILYHFGSKAGFYESVLQRAFEELNATVGGALVSGESYRERLTATTRALLQFTEGRPGVTGILIREVMDPSEPGSKLFKALVLPTLDMLEGILRVNAGDHLTENFPIRSALLAIFASNMLHVVGGDIGRMLWGPGGPQVEDLVEVLFLSD